MSSRNDFGPVTPAITKKYLFKRQIGQGAYGVVWAAEAVDTGAEMAIKKVGAKNFEESILAKRALRELKLLRHLRGNDNIATFVDVDINDEYNFNEIYLVEGLMEADLNQIIKSRQALSDQHYQYFVYQILRGLKWMHSADIVHRDLKPGNLLVNSDCELKICDFGLARGVGSAEGPFINTEYVATRYYRAPEVVLSPKHYTKALDIWSVGCIFGELINGKILFKGKDYIDQLQRIFEILGTPNDPSLTRLCTPRVLKYLRSWKRYEKVNLAHVFPKTEAAGIDLIDRLLTFNPDDRITAEEALAHPYLASYHQPDEEPNHPEKFDFSFEAAQTIEDIKKLIIEEVKSFKRHTRREEEQARRHARGSAPGVRRGSFEHIPRFEDQLHDGPTNIEEELHLRDLRIDE
ncbi:kinase-like domain-containing protein [Zopfochytrium polystomum]|nr:kinase-like domain-containing protein [Zopfochytrium polystomum]